MDSGKRIFRRNDPVGQPVFYVFKLLSCPIFNPMMQTTSPTAAVWDERLDGFGERPFDVKKPIPVYRNGLLRKMKGSR